MPSGGTSWPTPWTCPCQVPGGPAAVWASGRLHTARIRPLYMLRMEWSLPHSLQSSQQPCLLPSSTAATSWSRWLPLPCPGPGWAHGGCAGFGEECWACALYALHTLRSLTWQPTANPHTPATLATRLPAAGPAPAGAAARYAGAHRGRVHHVHAGGAPGVSAHRWLPSACVRAWLAIQRCARWCGTHIFVLRLCAWQHGARQVVSSLACHLMQGV